MNTRKKDKDAVTSVDKTVVFDQEKISPSIDPLELRKTLGIGSYSQANFYGKTTPLGEGGVGMVLKGYDSNLGRDVAVKIIKPQMSVKRNTIERFIREARTTAQIEHPNIVPVHEMGINSDWGLYFTMKKIIGEDFRKILLKLKVGNSEYQNKYSLSRLLNIFTDVCNGIAYAHSKGVMHRDLKPDNIFIGNFGEVLIIDWGLVRKINSKDAADKLNNATDEEVNIDINLSTNPNITMEGHVSGTPYYMSPQQAKGENNSIDHRSDIYTLGVILYEILTLKLPFEGHDVKSLIKRVVNGKFLPPRKAGSKRKIPIELEAICLKAMSYYPENRYQRVEDLLKDIYNYFDHFPVSVVQHSIFNRFWKLCLRHKILFVGLFAVLFTSVTGFFIHQAATYVKYNILYDSASQHIEQSISELRNADKFLAASNKLRQANKMSENKQQCDMLDAQCIQSGKRAEENAELAIALLDGIPEQFKSTQKVQRAYIQLLKRQITHCIKTKNSKKAKELLNKLEEILATNASITEADKKRQIKKLHAKIKNK